MVKTCGNCGWGELVTNKYYYDTDGVVVMENTGYGSICCGWMAGEFNFPKKSPMDFSVRMESHKPETDAENCDCYKEIK
jgi:hypothetical protein